MSICFKSVNFFLISIDEIINDSFIFEYFNFLYFFVISILI